MGVARERALGVLSVVTVGGPEYAGTIERADDEYVVRDGRSTRIGSFTDLESAKRTLGDTA